MSADGEHWADADVSDVSSGGLKFHSTVEYGEGETLWFDLVLEGFFTAFEVKTLGQVRRKARHGEAFHYGIAFRGLSQEKKIRIDENVRGDRPVGGSSYEANE